MHAEPAAHFFRNRGSARCAAVAQGREKRPAFDKLCKDASRGHLDFVMAWSIDRLGRSLSHVVNFIAELSAQNVGLYLHQQAVDSSTPSGNMMLSMCGVFAEFERSMIIERVRAGLARARAQGKTLGRPRVQVGVVNDIKRLRSQGLGMIRIARTLGIGVSVVQRVCAENDRGLKRIA